MENWKLEKKIDQIIDDNCKEIPWEGIQMDKYELKQDILELIKELLRKE